MWRSVQKTILLSFELQGPKLIYKKTNAAEKNYTFQQRLYKYWV
jgi:hypothetical protein